MHEPSIRIPLIACGPGLPEGKVVTQQVLTVDVAPSLLDLCGAPPIADVQGRSWRRLVNEGDPAWRAAWFYEYNYEKQFPYTPNVRGIRTDQWKYMHYPPGDGTPDKHLPEMYNLSDDPGERRNLATDPQFAAMRRQLEGKLAELLAAAGLDGAKDKMPLDEGIKSELPDQKIR
jgi:arylsulfatase A-like enzyme